MDIIRNRRIQRRLLAGALACTVFLAGCGNQNGSKKSDDGRSYGGKIEGSVQEAVKTAFFDVTVNKAEQNELFSFQDGLYKADSGKTYLTVELTITNTYEKDLPMSITDFYLDYDGNGSEEPVTGYGRSELLLDYYMENVFTLKQGESVTGTILFNVDKKDSYKLCYQEYYEDGFHGDTMEIGFIPEVREVSETKSGNGNAAGAQEAGKDTGAGDGTQEAGEDAGAGDGAQEAGEDAGAGDGAQEAGEDAGAQE